MKKSILAFIMIITSAFAFAGDFTLKVDNVGGVFAEKSVFGGFGCTGENISPMIKWQNAPEGTKSFVLNVYDPDAPTGSGWWHWVAINIPADASKLAEGAGNEDGAMPKDAVNMRNDYGTYAYGGPCPPVGDKPHRYIFTLYAMKLNKLEVPKDSSAALVGFMTRANAIASAETIMMYGR
jgi:Raf kinase inhibitor-like YbhB/YbcL family protein